MENSYYPIQSGFSGKAWIISGLSFIYRCSCSMHIAGKQCILPCYRTWQRSNKYCLLLTYWTQMKLLAKSKDSEKL